MNELPAPPLEPELASGDPVAELSPAERHRAAQRETDHLTSLGYVPNVLHPGNDQVPPLVRTASGALYAIRRHQRRIERDGKVAYVETIQHVRVDREPRSKKERRRLRALAKARQPQTDVRDGAREARLAHTQETTGCNSRPCNQPHPEPSS